MHPVLATAGIWLAGAGLVAAAGALSVRNLRMYCAALAALGTGLLTEAATLRITGLAVFGAAWTETFGVLWLHFSGARLPGRAGRLLAAVPAPWPFQNQKGRS